MVNVGFMKIIDLVTENCVRLLEGEFGLEVFKTTTYMKDVVKINPDYLNSFIVLRGYVPSVFAFSYEKTLIEFIFKKFVNGIDVDATELELYKEESAGEIMNMTIGNSLRDFKSVKSPIKLSPPVVHRGSRNLINKEDTEFYSSKIVTSRGKLHIYLLIRPMTGVSYEEIKNSGR